MCSAASKRTHEGSLEEATRLSSTNALAFARLAQKLVATNQAVRSEAMEKAEWFSRYATHLAPNDPEILRIRQTVMEQVRR
jgi:hypothetical protein